MLVYKHEHPKEFLEILNLKKIPYIKCGDEFDVLGINGDNLQGLISLLTCYKNSIKLIYADVPYNTGGQDFIYNDKFITEDSINRHSSWISWMVPRLMVSKELLSENGVLVISIDENERKNLESLCSSIFGEKNVLSLVTVVSNKGGGGRRNKKDLNTTNEFLVICAKNIEYLEFGRGVYNEKKTKEKNPRSVVAYNQRLILNRTTQFYPFLINKQNNSVTTINKEEYDELVKFVKDVTSDYRKKNNLSKAKKYDSLLHQKIEDYVNQIKLKYEKDFKVIFPIYDNKWGRWVPSYEAVLEKKGVFSTLYEKDNQIYYLEDVKDFLPMKTTLDNDNYSNSFATKSLKELYGEKNFDTPKSPILMRDIITSFTDDGDIVLDWCAGSNSTYHGVFLANKLQGVFRKYIYIQKDENDSKIFSEHSEKRVELLNENLKLEHKTTSVELMETENLLLNQEINSDIENYILNVENVIKSYNRFIEKSKKFYDLS